jgi:hypothetical protein
MYDIQDSPAYNSLEIGLKRVVDKDRNVRDIEANPGSRRLLTSCDLGLGMTLNLDWYVVMLACHNLFGFDLFKGSALRIDDRTRQVGHI